MNTPNVYLRVNRVAAELCSQARDVTVADLHESTASLGFPGLMSPRMRRVTPGKIAGPAVTALCQPGDNLMMHRALRLAQPGDVLVVVCQSETSAAQWGDVATRYAVQKGLAGVVVQGSVRDIDVVAGLGFPVWATKVWPIHAEKGKGGAVNLPVTCGDVLVNPGDLVVADGDGVVVVARRNAEAVVNAAKAKMRREDEIAAAMQEGGVLWDLSGAAAAYAKLGLVESDTAFDD
ncbi:RraA family protein [Ramlibacter sp. G-1-2-2]|uniref:Putative 4-hydroxy-4-methyl-2-oxoglutarate aldolase n=1 Tax=Ramlibacter agri TaxID=2728837 RepID=A0A848H1H4_9BURK|nr:RraA family protein [Ramlibacter agri]NML44665.1 RraA family protein [Ramlibacter agri]